MRVLFFLDVFWRHLNPFEHMFLFCKKCITKGDKAIVLPTVKLHALAGLLSTVIAYS